MRKVHACRRVCSHECIFWSNWCTDCRAIKIHRASCQEIHKSCSLEFYIAPPDRKAIQLPRAATQEFIQIMRLCASRHANLMQNQRRPDCATTLRGPGTIIILSLAGRFYLRNASKKEISASNKPTTWLKFYLDLVFLIQNSVKNIIFNIWSLLELKIVNELVAIMLLVSYADVKDGHWLSFFMNSRWLACIARPMWMWDKVKNYVNQSWRWTHPDDFYNLHYGE